MRRTGKRTIAAVGAAAVLAAGGVTAALQHDSAPRKTATHAGLRKDLDGPSALALAKRSGKPVEATALRTSNSTTYAYPDSRLHAQVYFKNIRVKKNGAWVPIDTTLVRTTAGWSPRATDLAVTFSSGARTPAPASRDLSRAALTAPRDASGTANALITVVESGHTMTLSWPGAIPTPVVDGSRALYPEILPGVDLLLSAKDDNVGELLIVKTPEAAQNPQVAKLQYLLSSPDLSFSLDARTAQVHANAPDGTQVLSTATPLMWDSNGAGTLPGDDTLVASPSDTASPSDSASPDPEPSPSQSDPLPGMPPFTPVPVAEDTPTADPTDSPSPSPTHSGDAASLDLPGLAGPAPDSHGALVATDLDTSGTLTLTPDQKLLTDAKTVYPVFIDPTISSLRDEWAIVYKKYPDSHFINGANYNDGTDEARVGFESTTWGTSRSFYNIKWPSTVYGAKISKVTFYAKESYSWSCTPESFDIGFTSAVTSSTSWNSQPAWDTTLATPKVAYGRSACPQDWVSTSSSSLLSTAQWAADHKWAHITIGMRATDESDPYYWKKFQANGDHPPYFSIVYDRAPDAPKNLDMDPGTGCTTTGAYPSVGKTDITFHAQATDPDGQSDLNSIYLIVGKTKIDTTTGKRIIDNNSLVFHSYVTPTSAGAIAVTLDQTLFANGVTYGWAAASKDNSGISSAGTPAGTYCFFTYDTSRPSPPTVTSSDFPPPGPDGNVWSTKPLGTQGSFTFSSKASDAVVKYEWSFNTDNFTKSSGTLTAGSSYTPDKTDSQNLPHAAGPNVLYVRSSDAAGNTSDPQKYLFYVTPSSKSGTPGDYTGDGNPDLYIVDSKGALQLYTSDGQGHLSAPARADYHRLPDGTTKPDPDVTWTNARITFNGDYWGADGIQDLVAAQNGKLWVYPGDAYGGFDTDQRRQLILPSNSPAPSTFDQILSLGDATGDGRPDLLAVVGSDLWAFTGYTGGTFQGQAVKIGSGGWDNYTILTGGDFTGDGAVDLIMRNKTTGELKLRPGTKSGNATDITSLGRSSTADQTYATGYPSSTIKLLLSTPDANGDGIPDLWSVNTDGTVHFIAGGHSTAGTSTTITPLPPAGGWDTIAAANLPQPTNEWLLAASGADTNGTNPANDFGNVTYDSTDNPPGHTGAATFDGDGFLATSTSALDTTKDYTVSAWVNLDSLTTSNQEVLCQGTTQHQAFYLGYYAPSKTWYFQQTTTDDSNTAWPTVTGLANLATAGTWTQLTATYTAPQSGGSGGVMTLYVNGTPVANTTTRTPIYEAGHPLTTSGCVNWTTPPDSASSYSNLTGSVADVQVWNRALTGSQAAALAGPVFNLWQPSPTRINANGAITDVAAAALPDGTLHVETLVPGSGVYDQTRSTTGTWGPATNINANGAITHIAAAATPDGTLHIQTLIPNTGVYDQTRSTTGTWGPATNINANGAITDIAAAATPDGTLHIQTLIPNTGVYDQTRTTSGTWGPATNINANGAITHIAAAATPDGTLHIQTVAPGSGVYDQTRSTTGTWGPATKINTNGSVTDIAAAATPDGTLHIQTLVPNRGFYDQTRFSDGTWTAAPASIDPNAALTTVATAALPNGTMHVEALIPNDGIYDHIRN